MPETPKSTPEEHRPARGGSFLRQADGTLVPEHPLPDADPLTTPPEASPLAPPRPQRSRPAPATEKEG